MSGIDGESAADSEGKVKEAPTKAECYAMCIATVLKLPDHEQADIPLGKQVVEEWHRKCFGLQGMTPYMGISGYVFYNYNC